MLNWYKMSFFLGVFMTRLFGVLFRVCVGLAPCVPWFQLFIIVLVFNHCVPWLKYHYYTSLMMAL